MKKGRVLVVDDERAIRRAVSRALSSRGFLVDVAADGEEALGSVRTFDPDLMVLDLNLPELGGLEVCRRVRAWSAVPILVLSVREEEADKVAALDLGADDYLTKPFGVDELMARVRPCCAGPARGRRDRFVSATAVSTSTSPATPSSGTVPRCA
jgi:two-component system KDP operon response regulator KdpE